MLKAMLVASAVLPMAGTAGEDDQVGALQAAHHAGRDRAGRSRCPTACRRAGRRCAAMSTAVVSACGEALEAAVVAARLGELVELALGVLDLVARREVDRRVVGDVDHVLADDDQERARIARS